MGCFSSRIIDNRNSSGVMPDSAIARICSMLFLLRVPFARPPRRSPGAAPLGMVNCPSGKFSYTVLPAVRTVLSDHGIELLVGEFLRTALAGIHVCRNRRELRMDVWGCCLC